MIAVPAMRRYRTGAVLLIITISWIVLAFPWLSGAVTIPWDAKAHFQPQLAFLAKSLASGQSPFWTPHVFGGHPQIADPQSLIFSPHYLLLALLSPAPGLQAMDGVLFASLLFGGVFVVLYFRDRGWHEAGAVLAAMAFMFGGMAAWRIQHVGQILSIATLPVALWLLDRALRRASLAYGFCAGVIAGFMLLGRDQVAWLGTLFLAAYALHVWIAIRPGWRASLKPLIAGALGGGLTVIVPMVMTLLLAADSSRAVITLEDAGKGSLHPWSLMTLVIPHLFGIARPLADYWGPPSPDWGYVDLYLARNMATLYFGILPLMLLLLVPFLSRWRPKIANAPGEWSHARDAYAADGLFMLAATLIFLLYSLGRYTPLFSLIYLVVPGIDRFRRPADGLFLVSACAAYAGGYGLHRWISLPRYQLPRWALILFLTATGLASVSGFWLASTVGKEQQTIAPVLAAGCFLIAALIFLQLIRMMRERVLLASCLAAIFMLADLGWNNAANESTGLASDTYDVLRPDTANETIRILKQQVAARRDATHMDRVELAGLGFHWPNATMIHDLHHTLGYNPIRNALYSQAVGTRDHIAGPDQRLFTPLFPSYRSLMADMLGLRLIASPVPLKDLDPKADPADFPLIAQTPDAYIYENPRALPRVLFPDRAVFAETATVVATGQWPEGVNPRETVVLSRPVTEEEMRPRPGARDVRLLRYTNTEIVIEAQSESGGFVVLNDVADDWWRATLNGVPARIEKANIIFRAVAVPPGRHLIRMQFQPIRGAYEEVHSMVFGK